jgi:phage FluMu protein Com
LKASLATRETSIAGNPQQGVLQFRCQHCHQLIFLAQQLEDVIIQAKCPKCDWYNVLVKNKKGFDILCYKDYDSNN